jgi:hypothetical protein
MQMCRPSRHGGSGKGSQPGDYTDLSAAKNYEQFVGNKPDDGHSLARIIHEKWNEVRFLV